WLDGVNTPCQDVLRDVDLGDAMQCPDNDCGPRVVPNFGFFWPVIGDDGQWHYGNFTFSLEGFYSDKGVLLTPAAVLEVLGSPGQPQLPPVVIRPAACLGVAASDLQYDVPKRRKGGVMQTGGEHIYKNHIEAPLNKSIYVTFPPSLPSTM